MKWKLTAAEWAALPADSPLRVMYVMQADGSYQLPLIDYTDPAPLISARDREKEDARVLREANAALTTEVANLKKETPKDINTLRSAHEQAINELTTTTGTTIKELRGEMEKLLIAKATDDLAGGITATSANANVMKPHVQSRLTVEWDGNKPVVKVKAADGTVGAALTEDTGKVLSKEFVDNSVFGAIVVKSKASGGGAAGASAGAAGGAGATGDKKLSDMNQAERIALHASDPAAFKELVEADKAARTETATAPVKPLFR